SDGSWRWASSHRPPRGTGEIADFDHRPTALIATFRLAIARRSRNGTGWPMFGRNSPWRLAALAVLTVGATAVTATPAAPARADTGPVNVTVNVTAALIFTISGAVTLAGAPGDTPS